MRSTRRLGAVFSALLLVGCATTRYEEYGTPLDQEADAPPAEITSGTGVQDTVTQRRVSELEMEVGDRLAGMEAVTGELSDRVAALAEQVDQLRRQVNTKRQPTQPPPAPRQPPAVARPVGEATLGALYALALNDYNGRQFDQSVTRLREVQAMDPGGELADNAQYWIGECQYAKGDFRTALETFRGVFGYPKTEKDDDAQLKLGLCHLRLGENESALIELKRLVVDYPESEYLGRAEELIRQARRRLDPGP